MPVTTDEALIRSMLQDHGIRLDRVAELGRSWLRSGNRGLAGLDAGQAVLDAISGRGAGQHENGMASWLPGSLQDASARLNRASDLGESWRKSGGPGLSGREAGQAVLDAIGASRSGSEPAGDH
jgi:hypothetical protein